MCKFTTPSVKIPNNLHHCTSCLGGTFEQRYWAAAQNSRSPIPQKKHQLSGGRPENLHASVEALLVIPWISGAQRLQNPCMRHRPLSYMGIRHMIYAISCLKEFGACRYMGAQGEENDIAVSLFGTVAGPWTKLAGLKNW